MSYLFHFIIVSLQKIGGTSAIQNKSYCTRLALSLQKIGGMGAMSREIPGADKDG